MELVEFLIFFKVTFFLQLVSFTVDGDPLYPTGCVHRYTSHVIFLMHFTCVNDVFSHHMAQVSACARHFIFMPSMMSGCINGHVEQERFDAAGHFVTVQVFQDTSCSPIVWKILRKSVRFL